MWMWGNGRFCSDSAEVLDALRRGGRIVSIDRLVFDAEHTRYLEKWDLHDEVVFTAFDQWTRTRELAGPDGIRMESVGTIGDRYVVSIGGNADDGCIPRLRWGLMEREP